MYKHFYLFSILYPHCIHIKCNINIKRKPYVPLPLVNFLGNTFLKLVKNLVFP